MGEESARESAPTRLREERQELTFQWFQMFQVVFRVNTIGTAGTIGTVLFIQLLDKATGLQLF